MTKQEEKYLDSYKEFKVRGKVLDIQHISWDVGEVWDIVQYSNREASICVRYETEEDFPFWINYLPDSKDKDRLKIIPSLF